MSPFPAILALRDSWVHIHTPNCGNIVAYIEAPVNEEFRIFTALYIPDVNPNDGHIGLGRYFDNSRFGS